MRLTRNVSWNEIMSSQSSRLTDGERPEENLEQAERKQLLAEAITRLPGDERLAVTLYYMEDLRLKEIGEVLGLSESRVCRVLKPPNSRSRNISVPGKKTSPRRKMSPDRGGGYDISRTADEALTGAKENPTATHPGELNISFEQGHSGRNVTIFDPHAAKASPRPLRRTIRKRQRTRSGSAHQEQ